MFRSALLLFTLAWSWAAPPVIDSRKLVDLSYELDEHTVYWPTAEPFHYRKDAASVTPKGYWYASGTFTASEHGGTHLDSPYHFSRNGWSDEQIPLASLVRPAVVVDVRKQCEQNADYRLTVADLTAWEKQHGEIPSGAIVFIETGWGRFWPDRKRYLGSDQPKDTQHLHFPGLSREAAAWLANIRKVAGVGIDTASLDYGQSQDFIAHQTLAAANVYGLENVAHLDALPATGVTVIALPIKIKGGTGGPVRIVAILP